jgi:hypothetical protein
MSTDSVVLGPASNGIKAQSRYSGGLFGTSNNGSLNTKNVDGDRELISAKGRCTPWVPKVSSGLTKSARQVA